MRHVYEGIKALLQTDPVFQRVYVADAGSTVPTMPYLILWGPGAADSSERSLPADDAAFDSALWVKVVAGTGEAALLGVEKVKAILDGAVFTAGTLQAEAVFKDTNPIQVDRDVVVPNTNRHPCFIDMRFHVWAS